MRVTIIGTGNMGRAIGTRALAGGHQVSYVGTHLSKAQELADEMIGEGDVSASEGVDGDVVVLAVPYTEAPHVVREYSEQLGGRIVIDPTNPVDFSLVEPLDAAWIAPFQSGGQLIAAETPDDAAFVKAFNTNFAGPLLAGQCSGVSACSRRRGCSRAPRARTRGRTPLAWSGVTAPRARPSWWSPAPPSRQLRTRRCPRCSRQRRRPPTTNEVTAPMRRQWQQSEGGNPPRARS
jgi:predicted dinucleotide-binding enzyme